MPAGQGKGQTKVLWNARYPNIQIIWSRPFEMGSISKMSSILMKRNCQPIWTLEINSICMFICILELLITDNDLICENDTVLKRNTKAGIGQEQKIG